GVDSSRHGNGDGFGIQLLAPSFWLLANSLASLGWADDGIRPYVVLAGTLFHTGDNCRRRATVSGMNPRAKSTSSGVFCLPRLKRMLALARSRLNPIASSTCDGSIAPEEHAAPVETASPFKSSAMTRASPSMPSK